MTPDVEATSGGGESRPRVVVDDPLVAGEVRAAFEAYELALVDHDLDALGAAFHDAPSTVRYGIAENLYGRGAIDRWREAAPPVPAGRTLQHTTIATFGRDAACVSTEFRYPGVDDVGRQSQTWVRFEQGWRIVAAHVSVIAA